MQAITGKRYPLVSVDGTGVVSHAGTALLRELADRVGLTAGYAEATDALRGPSGRAPAGAGARRRGGRDRRRRGGDRGRRRVG